MDIRIQESSVRDESKANVNVGENGRRKNDLVVSLLENDLQDD